MAKKQTRKGKSNPQASRGQEILESPEALAQQFSKTEEFVKSNAIFVYGAIIAVAVVIVGIFGYRNYMSSQNQEAQEYMFQAQRYFEADSLEYALNGDANNFGFLQIIDEYGGTQAADLASYYAGMIYMKQGNQALAIENLENYSSDDVLIQSRAYALLGDAYMELEEFGNAASAYEKAANHQPTKEYSPDYHMRAALAYELAGNLQKAIAHYEKVVNEYRTSTQVADAKREKARLETIMKG